jgi:hypothetical protein
MADEVTYTLEDGSSPSRRRTRPSARARSGACSARWSQNLVDGRDRGLHQGARNHRRRLSRARPGQGAASSSSATATTSISPVPKASRSRPRIRPRSRSAASTSRRSARSPPKSAAGASRSPTRARASSTRRVHLPQGRQEEVSHGETLSFRTPPSPRSHRAQGAFGQPSAPFHPSFGQAYLCPGHRRRAGHTVAAASTLDKDVRGSLVRTRRLPQLSASASPRPQPRLGVTRSCSTVVASSSMVA